MSECKNCGEVFSCKLWNETKHSLPILGEVIEGSNPKDWVYSKMGRGYFALVSINDKLTWITPSLVDMDYKEMKITHWRRISLDPKGRRAYVKIKKYKGFWEPKVILEKSDE